jgi:hypothetical protein
MTKLANPRIKAARRALQKPRPRSYTRFSRPALNWIISVIAAGLPLVSLLVSLLCGGFTEAQGYWGAVIVTGGAAAGAVVATFIGHRDLRKLGRAYNRYHNWRLKRLRDRQLALGNLLNVDDTLNKAWTFALFEAGLNGERPQDDREYAEAHFELFKWAVEKRQLRLQYAAKPAIRHRIDEVIALRFKHEATMVAQQVIALSEMNEDNRRLTAQIEEAGITASLEAEASFYAS